MRRKWRRRKRKRRRRRDEEEVEEKEEEEEEEDGEKEEEEKVEEEQCPPGLTETRFSSTNEVSMWCLMVDMTSLKSSAVMEPVLFLSLCAKTWRGDTRAALLTTAAFKWRPDDVDGKIREIIPAGFSCNADDFASLLEKEANFRPFGTLLHTYKVDMSCPGFQEYHARLQTFLMWFIETASFIDADDDHWDFFLVDMSCPGFQEYHARLQTFLMWFIETASFIDADDDHWDFFLV
ncbi:hypothetical protein CRUP_012279 [Coryphaenoides rupestris]|nr:hypothetical protein CRUP_012279 [Coryphaenoides rupestris]